MVCGLVLLLLQGGFDQAVPGHQEGHTGRGEEDELEDGAADREDGAEVGEENESEETSGGLAWPGEAGLVVEEADVGEGPEVVEDQHQQGAVRQELGDDQYHDDSQYSNGLTLVLEA